MSADDDKGFFDQPVSDILRTPISEAAGIAKDNISEAVRPAVEKVDSLINPGIPEEEDLGPPPGLPPPGFVPDPPGEPTTRAGAVSTDVAELGDTVNPDEVPVRPKPFVDPVQIEQTIEGPVDPRLAQQSQQVAQQAHTLGRQGLVLQMLQNDAETPFVNEALALYDSAPEEVEQILQEGQQQVQQQFAAVEALTRALSQQTVDPNRFFHERGAASSFAAAFAVAVGQMASVRTGTPNAALRIIDGAINRDLRAQELQGLNTARALNAQISLLDRARAITKDRASAIALVKKLRLEDIIGRAKAAQRSFTNPILANRFNQMVTSLEAKALEEEMKFQRGSWKATIKGPIRNSIKNRMRAEVSKQQLGATLFGGAPIPSSITAEGVRGSGGGGGRQVFADDVVELADGSGGVLTDTSFLRDLDAQKKAEFTSVDQRSADLIRRLSNFIQMVERRGVKNRVISSFLDDVEAVRLSEAVTEIENAVIAVTRQETGESRVTKEDEARYTRALKNTFGIVNQVKALLTAEGDSTAAAKATSSLKLLLNRLQRTRRQALNQAGVRNQRRERFEVPELE